MNVSTFKPRAPWYGGDLQTLRNTLVHRAKPLPGMSAPVKFKLPDGSGDTMTGALDTPHKRSSGPLIILLHGLTGCNTSAYMWEASRAHLNRGRQVLRLNLRGAGSSAKTCSKFYYAGSHRDIESVLDQLDPPLVQNGVFIVGFSLGGSILLNLLARAKLASSVVGAACVSTPLDLMQATRRMMEPRNRFYHKRILTDMKRELHAKAQDRGEAALIREVQSLLELDDRITAPRHGYSGVEDFYQSTSGLDCLPNIKHPLLLIHAADDPWIPAKPYMNLASKLERNITSIVTTTGGHVGFHAQRGQEPWHNVRIAGFVKNLTPPQ